MAAEKGEKTLGQYALDVTDAKNSGDKMAIKNALDAQKEALKKEISKPDIDPKRRDSLSNDVTKIERELEGLPLRARSSARAQPTKPQVPTLPAAPKWKTVGHNTGGALRGAMHTLSDLTNTKNTQSNTGNKPKPLPPTPTMKPK